MKKIEVRQYEMLVRVQGFAAAHSNLFPEASLAAEAVATVGEAVKQLSEYAVTQVSLRHPRAGARPTPRKALWRALATMSRTARAIEAHEPGFKNTFRLPERRPNRALVATGRSFARDAEPVADRFIVRGMPTTFVTDLNGLVDAFEKSIRGRQTGKDQRIATRARIEAALASALSAVQQLDVIVVNQLQDDPVTMAVWESDRRVAYPKSAKAPAAALAPAPAKPVLTPVAA
jgi:hypothetical protein